MKILVVSDREYRKTSRGIDMITTLLADKGYFVDHLVFFRRKRFPEKQVTNNIRQLYLYDCIKLYRGKLQFLFPGFLLLAYFHYIIAKSCINLKQYDYIVLESGHPIYFSRETYPRIIYRQADPTFISFNSNRLFYRKLELEVIKKSLFVSSALKEKFFSPDYKNKMIHCHSGFVPYKKTTEINKEMVCFIGGGLDWNLIKKIAKKNTNYIFNVIGVPGRCFIKKNIHFKGYLDFSEYQNNFSCASLIIIPYSKHFSYQLRQTSYSAKILTAMQMGKPILVKAYGDIQNTDINKKLYVYKTNKEALSYLEIILTKIERGEIIYEVSKETQDFLFPQIAENRLKELDKTFSEWIK
jgi:hypothetical protein